MPIEVTKYQCTQCKTVFDSVSDADFCEKKHESYVQFQTIFKKGEKYPSWIELCYKNQKRIVYYLDPPVDEDTQQSEAEIEIGEFRDWFDAWFPSGDDKHSGSIFFAILREEEIKGRSKGQSRLQTLKNTFLRLRDIIDGNPILSTNPEDHF